MNEMVERAARAIATSLHRNPDAALADGRPTWLAYVPTASAAIAAMREPTLEMRLAPVGREQPVCLDVWHSMIDAALSD